MDDIPDLITPPLDLDTDTDTPSNSLSPPPLEPDVVQALQINDVHFGYNTLNITRQYDWVERVWSYNDEIGHYPQEPVEGIKINHRVLEVTYLAKTPQHTMLYDTPEGEKILVCGCNRHYSFTPGIAGKEYLKPCLLKLDNDKRTLGFEYSGDYYFFVATINDNPVRDYEGTKNPNPSITIESIFHGNKGYIIRLMQCEPRIYMINDHQFVLVEFDLEDGHPTSLPFLF